MLKKLQCKKIINEITKADEIYLFRHVRPDPDALGSALGLKELIKDNFPNKKVFTLGEDYPHLYHLFPKPNKIKIIKSKKSLAIITDTANKERVDGDLWKECKKSIKIDHHPLVEKFTDIEIINSNSIAACEMVADWAFQSNLKMSKKAAEYLYLGLLTDSGRFMFPNTSSKTFAIAAKLLEAGVDLKKVHSKLYTRKLAHGKIQAHILTNAKISNKVASIIITKDDIKKFGLNVEETKIHANTLAGFEEVDIWVLGVEEDDFIKVSSRSKFKYSINKVATQFNGGGHKNAAGLKVKNKTEFNKFIKELKKIIK